MHDCMIISSEKRRQPCDFYDVMKDNKGQCLVLNASPVPFKDRHQWLGREFRWSLSSNMDKLFLNAITYKLFH